MYTNPAPYRPLGSGYVSEFDQFLDCFLHRHPEVAVDRQRGRARWWDRLVDFDALQRAQADSLPFKPPGNEWP